MKRWIKRIGIVALVVGVASGSLYYMGYPYKSSFYMAKVIDKNEKLNNYEKEIAISLSVNSEKGNLSSFEKVDGSFLVINEKRDADKRLIEYNLTSQGEAFEGELYEDERNFIFKSPMYHRYILFDERTEKKKDEELKTMLTTSLFSNLPNMKVERDIGANEDGIKTLSIPFSNESLLALLKNTIQAMDGAIPFEDILYQNEKITNKLLNTNKTEEEVEVEFQQDKERILDTFSVVLNDSKVVGSNASIKISEDNAIKEVNLIIELMYEELGVKVPFTIYIDVNTWNMNKTKVEKPVVDPTNSLTYDMMTNEISYFKNENLDMESQPEEDDSHTLNEISESTEKNLFKDSMTLEELGDDFTPVLPSDNETTNKQNEE